MRRRRDCWSRRRLDSASRPLQLAAHADCRVAAARLTTQWLAPASTSRQLPWTNERLWAPWRLSYIAGDATADADAPEPTAWRDGRRSGVLHLPGRRRLRRRGGRAGGSCWSSTRGEHTVAVLNRYPYNNGHLLVCPLRHVARARRADRRTSTWKRWPRSSRFTRALRAADPGRGLQHRPEPGPRRRRRRAGAPALAPRAALDRRQQLHAGDGGHAGHLAIARRAVGSDRGRG